MRFLLVFFLAVTIDVTFGESPSKSFNWGLANQNPGKQFFVDERTWEKKATNLLRGENKLNVLRKFGKPIEKIQKRPVQGMEIHRSIQTKKIRTMNYPQFGSISMMIVFAGCD